MALSTVLQQASDYVDRFQQTFSNLVVEERYVQLIKRWNGEPPTPLLEPELRWSADTGGLTSSPTRTAIRRRQLLSDLLLVQPAGQPWIAFRDVAEVDGRPVRERAVRVERLLLSDSKEGHQQLQRIAKESARYNLGASRNINLPTFPLQLLRVNNRDRFKWTIGARDRLEKDLPNCTVIAFRETASPTMVRTDQGVNVPMTGQFCIEAESGRVRRATVRFAQRLAEVNAAFEVRFQPVEGMAVLAPESAWEWSISHGIGSSAPSIVEGLARYSHIRRFSVTTKEHFK